jgi:short-subunit dehydrogenase
MLDSGEPGHVVNTSSMAVFTAFPPLHSPYIASKHAVQGLTEGLRAQLDNLTAGRVSASVLVPGLTATNIWARELGPDFGDPVELQIKATGARQTPMQPRDTAELVLDCVTRGDFWIFPNPEARSRIEARHARIQEGLTALGR